MKRTVNEVYERAEKIIEAGKRLATDKGRWRLDEFRLFTEGYAEPGYTEPASGVICLGNYNNISHWEEKTRQSVNDDDTPGRVAGLLEKLGIELEWSDEWLTCEDCGKLVRCQPNSYQWQRSYWDSEGCGCYCVECVKATPQGYLEYLEGHESRCDTMDIDLGQHGYAKLEGDYQNGWHGGQDADPKVIAKSLRELGIKRFIFKLDQASQFYIEFSVYVHKDELATLDLDKWEHAKKSGPDPVEGLKKALREATIQHAQVLGEGGAVVTKCYTDGTAETRRVSPQEFIDGKALA